MLECFVPKNFNASSKVVIGQANTIIGEYQTQGFTLTLRQLYYQFVARGLLPNTVQNYKRLGSILNDARLAGLVDWSAIEDRTRNLRGMSTWDEPSSVIASAAYSYRENLWRKQKHRVEVWIEKDALLGVIEPACTRWRTDYFACRGYTSQSEQYRAGKRYASYKRQGFEVIVLHLGDHDPSGIDMTRDNNERLDMFAQYGVTLKRLALNMNQVKRYNPPPNPAKESDSRCAAYKAKYGDTSWELDALDPRVIDKLLEDNIRKYVDDEAWELALGEERAARATLDKISANYADIVEFLENR